MRIGRHGVRSLLLTLLASVLGLWLGLLVLSGIAAAVTFPTMRELSPSLMTFALYPGEHWRIAAGMVANGIFGAANTGSWVCGVVALVAVTLLAASERGERRTRALLMARWFVVVPIVVLAYNTMILRPRMDSNLSAFYEAARDGRVEAADTYRAAFEEDHPNASRVLGAMALSVLLSIVGAGAAARSPRR